LIEAFQSTEGVEVLAWVLRRGWEAEQGRLAAIDAGVHRVAFVFNTCKNKWIQQ
jgi:hypothetical protein